MKAKTLYSGAIYTLALLAPTLALAQTAESYVTGDLGTMSAASSSATYLSDMFKNFANQWESTGWIFSILCELGAGFLTVVGLHNVWTHGVKQEKPLREGVFKLAGAGLVGGFPFVVNAVLNSIYGNVPNAIQHSYFGDSIAPSSTGLGLDTVMTNLVANIYQPAKFAIKMVTFVGGMIALFKAAWNMAHSGAGRDAPSPSQTTGLAVGGAILISLGQFSDVLTATIFGQSQPAQFSSLNYTISGMNMTQVNNVYKALFAFVEINGFIAVARAAFIAQQVGAGKSQKTYGQAAVFFVAGVVAINMASFVKILGSTIGIQLINV